MNEKQRTTLELLNVTTIPKLEFIVPRGHLPETLEAEICSSDSVKVLVAGQRGMGKTTELRRLSELLRQGVSHLPVFVAFGSQESITETALLLAMANALYSHPEAKLTEADMREIRDWESTVEIGDTLEETRLGEASIGGSIPILTGKAGVARKRAQSTKKTRTVAHSKGAIPVQILTPAIPRASLQYRCNHSYPCVRPRNRLRCSCGEQNAAASRFWSEAKSGWSWRCSPAVWRGDALKEPPTRRGRLACQA